MNRNSCLLIFSMILLVIYLLYLHNNQKSSILQEEEFQDFWPHRKTSSPTINTTPIPGTPHYVSKSTDCAIRSIAFEYGKQILATPRSNFRTLFDALNLQSCGKMIVDENIKEIPKLITTESRNMASVLIIYVDAKHGKDSHGGTKEYPLLTISAALDRVSKARASKSQIILRAGTYYISPDKPLILTKAHNELTIRNSPGERSIISGAERLKIKDWKFVSKNQEKDYSIWSTVLHSSFKPFDGLRVGNLRMVRAKTPNGAPEMSQHNFQSSTKDQVFNNDGKYLKGWKSSDKNVEWIKPKNLQVEKPPIKVDHILSEPYEWPNVYWPKFQPPTNPKFNIFEGISGAGGHGPFELGSHGTCSNKLDPPIGYFCSKSPARGEDFRFRAPEGMILKEYDIELNEDAILVAWRGNHDKKNVGNPRWFTWTWKIESWKKQGNDKLEILFDQTVGGNQGAQGSDNGDYFYFENIKSGLDEPGEYYFDSKSNELFIVINGTHAKPSGSEDWGFVRSKELIRILGTPKSPVKNINFIGIEFRDTALTWLDPHQAPTGGDWTIPKTAAISSHGGLSGLGISDCIFERLDGSAILLDGYHRNVNIQRNEFSWLGASAIISIGRNSNCLNALCSRKVVLDGFTQGPDGREGNQPRETRIVNNLFREIGVFTKQSAAYFSSLSGKSKILNNVMFNAPRAMINFNDGFLGGDEIVGNLIFNCVRESADHGPINLWDRVPYIWEGVQNFKGGGTVVPLPRVFERNFIIANHASQSAIDSDDGASWLVSKNNVFIYGGVGLKSDFGGHHHESIGDLYFLLQWFCFIPIPQVAPEQNLQLVFRNNTCVVSGETPYAYGSKCHSGSVEVGKNRIATMKGELKVCDNISLKQALKLHPERDPGTTELSEFPNDQTVIQWIREKLF